MNTKWKPYPKYKHSGVEWLSEVPEHWDVTPMKYIAIFINGAPFKPVDWGEEGTPIIRIENLNGGGQFNYTTLQVSSKYNINHGDLLFAWSGNRGTSFGPFLWEKEGRYYLNQHIFRLEKYKMDKKFLYWALKGVTLYVEKQAHGIIGLVHITKEDLGIIGMPTISDNEQRAISAFLDRETAKIDGLIAKKERLIELLREKRAALISHAVTKGLDPSVLMKDSGIKWLENIPENWEAKKLKFVVSFYGGGTPSKGNSDYWTGDIPWVSPKDMKSEFITDTEDHITEEAVKESATRMIHPGAVLLVVRSGILRHTIPVAVNIRPVALNQDMKALAPKTVLLSSYLKYLIIGLQRILLVTWRKEGATVESIEFEFLANTSIPIPSIVEQKDISIFLDRELEKIDSLISKINLAVEKLREYRTALISAAVTGKIDVRQEVA